MGAVIWIVDQLFFFSFSFFLVVCDDDDISRLMMINEFYLVDWYATHYHSHTVRCYKNVLWSAVFQKTQNLRFNLKTHRIHTHFACFLMFALDPEFTFS